MVNFGTNLMKSAHNINSRDKIAMEGRSDQKIVKASSSSTRLWRVGMIIFVVGSIINFISFAFAAQSLLAALGTVQFVSNVVFAKCVLKEELTVRILVATSIIVFGLVVSIRFSNHSTEEYSARDLMGLYSMTYLFFLLGIGIFLSILHVIYLRYTYVETHKLGLLPFSDIIRPATYAIVSATVGTQSVLQSKCIAELVKATMKGHNQFNHWFLYVILVVFVCGLSFWLHRMNLALKKFDGLVSEV